MDARRWTGTVLAGAAIVTVTLAAPQADAGTPVREDSVAARAVTELTTSEGAPDASAVPDDFAAVIGYRPRIEDGLLVNPNGACSSPVPLPTEFDTPCKAHDLGYDLLRYAHLTGGDLGGWARSALDSQLDRRMHEACEARERDRTSCFAMANTATTAVSVNSMRQGYGVPVDEPWIRYTVGATLAALGLLAVAAVVRRVGRIRWAVPA
ncbi:hypothetical protein EGT67_01970 [Prescottella agglutinans]|uniref:Phospholipase A2 n=1 Tax=Prescottella agglutinans TaxID=1644129 RepID=A0A438BJX1_9NOCA|nr:hypothetical protein [Prescottella agglutinans]RVW11235.1 hypothetical protein EGT67_01970 [Prescottella agglutinans]